MQQQYKGVVEGLLFASGDEGITVKQIAKVIGVTSEIIDELIEQLKKDYYEIDRGITIIQSNEIFHLTTKREHNEYYKKLMQHPRTTRMSQAALETLAIIAYNQPITRIEIEEIRGVSSDYAVQMLLARSLIENVGRKDSIGRPILFGTSKEFLTYFGLSSIDELPDLPDEIDEVSIEQEADLFFNKLHE